MRRYCLALDLVDDPPLIEQYETFHRAVWPEVLESHRAAGVLRLEIYRTGDRLLMVMEVDENFSFERKAALDAANARVGEWEQLMSRFQKPISGARPGEKWLLMECIHRFESGSLQGSSAARHTPVTPSENGTPKSGMGQ